MARGNEFWQDFSSPHSEQQEKPVTIASATSIGTLVKTKLSIITGTTAIATITPPFPDAYHELVLVFTNANPGGVTTGGNIANAVDPAQYVPVLLFWNPLAQTYYAK